MDIYFSSSVTDLGDNEVDSKAPWTLWADNATFAKVSGTDRNSGDLGAYTGFDHATAPRVTSTLPTTVVRWVRFDIDSDCWRNRYIKQRVRPLEDPVQWGNYSRP